MKKAIHSASSQFFLFALCVLVYTCAYLSRDTFSATIPSIISITGATKTQMGTISTIFLIFYGFGQIFSGFLGDKFQPNRLIAAGLLGSAFCNYLFARSTSIVLMGVFWGLNGMSLSLLWAPMIKLLSTMSDDKHRYKFMVNISLSMPIGTLLAFFNSAFFIKNYTYKFAFYVNAIAINIIFVLFLVVFSRIKHNLPLKLSVKTAQKKESSIKLSKCFLLSGLHLIIFSIMFNGIIRNGVSTWVPTYLTEVFKMEAFTSVLTSTVIPVINMLGIYAGAFFARKTKNESLGASIMFFLAFIFLFALIFIGKISPFVAVCLLALTSSSVQGSNAIIMSLMPMYFRKYNKVATVTGVLNANNYMAASVGSYSTGLLASSYGWNATIYFWLTMSLLGIFTTLLCAKKWKNFIRISQKTGTK